MEDDAAKSFFPDNAGSDPASVGWTHPKRVLLATGDDPFPLEVGGAIGPVEVEYETYGELNDDRSNVILVLHALSGDAHAAGWDLDAVRSGRKERLRKPGWWETVIGPGKPLDTDKYHVICANFLGSCYGTTGPGSINPKTGREYGLTFPIVTVGDWVALQARLLDRLGIERVYCVVGGSLGGQQAIEWMMAYPERVEKAIVLAASARLSAQGLAFNAVGRHTIMHDQGFMNGNYYGLAVPAQGLAAARMLAHITYLSEEAMDMKFGRRLQDKQAPTFDFGIEFEVESYLSYQGQSFVQRFDANSYLYITRAMDYYDAAQRWGGGSLKEACSRVKADVMVVSFSSDWLYPPNQCKELAMALGQFHQPVTYINVPSNYGHDAFLVETEVVNRLLGDFLAHRRRVGR